MSDKPTSPRPSRGDSPPPRKRSRSNDDRSQSPRRERDRRERDSYRRNDNYRSRDNDRNRDSRRDSWRDRRDRDRDDSDRVGRGGDREERDSDRRDTDKNEGRDRDRPRPKKGFGGFKYKDKRRDELDDRNDDRRGGSFRGYRNRSPSPRRRDRDRDRDRARDSGTSSSKKSKSKSNTEDTSQPPVRAPAAPTGGGEEMIIVHVNDRLGTKAAIPCFASDRIKEFKIMVAARIGREPHEILLKRQGQRPFKDMLSLADYEISNGVQLDLEVDTGD
ncbi:ubiquitin-like protein [Hypoxylon trugodes]|uniref:ubiquitin-like protein n=1 Tax=Hypoxylon trugodes TaxID=326681 RepID=UPI00218FA568|nr:ubiquitin-like protein [Hypoxylon trugodes]KAI1389072.1 ubiquitin-like protein [Hypoxylon trugodes]